MKGDQGMGGGDGRFRFDVNIRIEAKPVRVDEQLLALVRASLRMPPPR